MSQIEQYLIFGQAARAGSFSRAAEVMGVSNSHVSKHIARLEQALGYKLFHRSPHLQLTEAGVSLLPVVESMITAYEQLTHTAPALKGEVAGVVRISLPPLIARELVIPRLAELLKDYPKLELKLTIQQPSLQAFSENLDLVVTLGFLPDSSLVSKRIGESRAILVATPRYLSRHGTPELPEDLKRHNCMASHFVHFENEMPWMLSKKNDGEQAQIYTVDVRGQVATNDIYTIKEMVRSDLGIGVMLDFYVEEELRNGSLQRVLSDYDFPIKPPVYIVYHDRELMPKSVTVVKDFLIGVIAERL